MSSYLSLHFKYLTFHIFPWNLKFNFKFHVFSFQTFYDLLINYILSFIWCCWQQTWASKAMQPSSLTEEGGEGYFCDSWSALFFPVKCEMANFFLVNRDFHSRREPWFSKMFSFIFREAWNANVVFFMNCERAALFSVKCDLYPPPPFTTLTEWHSWKSQISWL